MPLAAIIYIKIAGQANEAVAALGRAVCHTK